MSGFRNSGSNNKTYFLGINGDGNIYESSKEPKEGFVEHINPITNTPSGYRKEYYGGLVGYLNYIGLSTRPNKQNINVTYFVMTFRNYEDNEDYCFMFPLYKQNGGLHRYVKSFVKYYRSLDFSRELVFNAFKRRAGEQFAPSNLLFAYPGTEGSRDELIPMYFQKGKNGWPEAVSVKAFDGTTKKDYTEQDRFTYTKLGEYIADFGNRIQAIRANLMSKKSGNANVQPGQMMNQPQAAPQVQAVPVQQAPQPTPYQPAGNTYVAPQPQGYTQQPYNPQPQPQPQQPTSGLKSYSSPIPDYPAPTEDDLPF